MSQQIVALEADGGLEGSVLRDGVVVELQKIGRERILKSYWNTREYGSYTVYDVDDETIDVAVFDIEVGDTVVFRPDGIEAFVAELDTVEEGERGEVADVLERVGIPFVVVGMVDSE